MLRPLLALLVLAGASIAAPAAVQAQPYGYGPPPGYRPPPPPPPGWGHGGWRAEEWRRRAEWRDERRARWEHRHCGRDAYGREFCR